MNWVDFGIGVFAVLFFITGIRMGFIREVTGLIGLVLAFILAVAGTPIWADSMVDMLKFPPSVAGRRPGKGGHPQFCVEENPSLSAKGS